MDTASGLLAEISKTIYEFEKNKATEEVNKEGIFYTPIYIAFKMAKDCLFPLLDKITEEELYKLRIIDPACGAGIFLICCYQILIEKLNELQCNTASNRQKLLSCCLFGIDRDPTAINIAKDILIGICELSNEQDISNSFPVNLICKDFLLDDIRNENHFRENFSLIIGNPPYGMSRDEKLSASENEMLKVIFKDYKLAKVNKYMAFMARGFELLKEKGTISFIVPNAWLGISSAKKLREIFSTNGSFLCIEHFDKPAFPGLEVETVIFRYQKNNFSPVTDLILYSEAQTFDIHEKNYFPRNQCNIQNEFIIPLKWNNTIESIGQHFAKYCFKLDSEDSPFQSLIALQAYSVGKGQPPQDKETVKSHSFHSQTKLSADYLPYLEGKDICRYKLNWSGAYLKYGPQLAEPQKIERFSGPRILIREILDPAPYKLIAAYTQETYLYNKSVLHIIPRNQINNKFLPDFDRVPEENVSADEIDFLALLAILNSSLAGFIIQNFGRKSQRKLFPKIVNADLKSFPLPHTFAEVKITLSELTKEYFACTEDQKQLSNIQMKIDNSVLKAYGLKDIAIQ